ncbi:alpha/beta fold hydrolase [Chelativorans sp. M5D2P16]|uniref:alpha/beta fold hydrolase n=1 Tax=Chelativorans sp. M5D2P16 TaxID=3095678 RepID=UPI002ACA1D04|nr:alpha/beta fold hydrolase [Chelativorans sp. M5D2P16]MDZ5696638.1 alpha/beta fold hydrolase [Chelativorans sp. M5D2P16]
MSRDTVISGEARLSVQVEGEAGKPWLLVANSLASDLSMWDAQMPLLLETHRVIRWDTRGHGASSAPEGPYSFDMLVADMVAVLDHVGAERADIMGLSLGGMTALGLGLQHPQRVGRMIVCDARADNPPPFVAGWNERIAAIREGGMAAIAEGTLARWFTPGCDAQVREKARRMILATPQTGYTGCARALQELDYLKDLPGMRPPVLYVAGAEDQGAPREVMSAMAEATPRSQLAVLPGLAHLPNMENPNAFAGAVRPWLAVAASEHGA